MDASALSNPRLQAMLEEEKRKAMANEIVAKLTDVCWDKCITGSIGSSFSNSETSCLTNCAKRFMDLKMLTMQRFSGVTSASAAAAAAARIFCQELTMESSKDEEEKGKEPLDLKPLISLAPMFPTPMGYDVSTQSTDPLVLHVTPFRPATTASFSSERPQEAPASCSNPLPKSPAPIDATPISATFPTPRCKDTSSDKDYKPSCEHKKPTPLKTAKRTRQAEESNAADANRRAIRRSLDNELNLCASSSDSPKESVEGIMMMFDSLRRRILQLDEKEDVSKRVDLKAGTLMMKNNLRVNKVKTIGRVPGVEVGDIFFFRIEMCIVGLHAQAMGGIDYISAKHIGKDNNVAVCIISSGGYEDEDDDPDILVYTGQGGSSRHKMQHDQKLERGNLALMNSMDMKNQIRVVRSAQDPFCSGKIYIYDGLYCIEDSWTDTAKNGFNVFKYKLRREPGQPDGVSLWKMTEKWKANPATRDNIVLLDLSSKVEEFPVCLVNDVGGKKVPGHFNYVAGVKHLRPLRKTRPLQCCQCPNVCLPGDPDCSCAQKNGGDLPYSASGLLVKRVPMIYECSSNCQCSLNCRNRITQKGIKLNFEVFWTGDRGWGVRSWDPIRAGTFICEYAGEVIDETKMDIDGEQDEYTFRASCPGDKVLSWNLGAELLEEKSRDVSAENFKQLPIIIRATNEGNVARFLNHSCSPNLLWQAVQYDHADDSYPHVMFFAMKHIPPMTELTYDYGTRGAPPGFKGNHFKACSLKSCLCGSKYCRGLVVECSKEHFVVYIMLCALGCSSSRKLSCLPFDHVLKLLLDDSK
ncbi:hypothetical protein GUJ93_ZPchr0011g28814 [Zizania palustris]|uniref:Histone-lysine N-methyltransferase n=1 Tax=Zizania palustris TaxID=103762 RepID=A0A8J5WDS1_ZIZPA|nr:hypothetical protein GUJ93_ZPchr0011g28814 [Zizania palustris]